MCCSAYGITVFIEVDGWNVISRTQNIESNHRITEQGVAVKALQEADLLATDNI